MKKTFWLFLAIGLLVTLFSVAVTARAAITFNDPGFAVAWQRVDKPVQDTPGLSRGYTWGPPLAGTENIVTETYNGKARKVQYFDKARMEVTNPQANSNDLYYVTTGLLVREMVSGQRQDGDNTFANLVPSVIQVAGDSNEDGLTNGVAPGYASFKDVDSFVGKTSPASPTGTQINHRIDKAGNVSTFAPPESQTVTAYDNVTGHNIAGVFVNYGNATGQLWNGSAFTNGPIFFGNPTYVLGRPLTEPYWTRAVVSGVEQDVLVQLFERRVLTYTPTNPPTYRVEMGNTGQHYYRWRYVVNAPATTPINPTPSVSPTPSPLYPTPQASSPITYPTGWKGNGTVQDQNFISPILNQEVSYEIYLPPGYFQNTNQRYPVVYALHGYSGDYHEWADYGLLGRAEDLINTKTIRPVIIVLPYGAQAYWLNHSDNGPRWGDYTVYDVVNFIDANYRTLADPSHRAIDGISMGGHGALQNGFNHPEIFNLVGSHSPTLRDLTQSTGYFGDAAYFATIDPEAIARTKNLSGLKIYIDIGKSDIWLPRVQSLHQTLLDRNFAHTWVLNDGDHGGEYWSTHSPEYLKFYSDNFAP